MLFEDEVVLLILPFIDLLNLEFYCDSTFGPTSHLCSRSITAAVDVAIPQEHIALEVDGPHHFTRNSLRPLGDMFTRTALLEARGWKVISVPFFRWSGVDSEGQRALLQNLLEKARSGEHVHPTKET